MILKGKSLKLFFKEKVGPVTSFKEGISRNLERITLKGRGSDDNVNIGGVVTKSERKLSWSKSLLFAMFNRG